jgi:hypothetical protein
MPAFYVVFEKNTSNADVYVNGNFISKYSDALDKLAKQLGVRTLLSFFSTFPEEIASLLEVESVDSIKDNSKYAEKWFAADEGLRTVHALLKSTAESSLGDRDRIAAELQEFAKVLELARANSIRWHLAVDY